MPLYRFTGHKHPDELANGRPLSLGDEVQLSDEDVQANARLIDEGLLLEMSPSSDTRKKTRREESGK